MKYLTKELLDHLKYPHYMEGYSFKEIEEVEKMYACKFPEAYCEFLHLMGKQAYFFAGIDYSMYELSSFRGGAECNLYLDFGDIGLALLKKDDIVFLSSQGVTHCYMSLSEGENPPVHVIQEGMRKLEPIQTYESFTKFLRSR
jgi:hypothetical protein